jgi:hypothetical protein
LASRPRDYVHALRAIGVAKQKFTSLTHEPIKARTGKGVKG